MKYLKYIRATVSDLCLIAGAYSVYYGTSLWNEAAAYVITGVIIGGYGIMLGIRK
jgi:hypothetical protein